MNFYHPSRQYPVPFAYTHLLHHSEKFCTKERRIGYGPLGVISFYYSMASTCVTDTA